MFKFVVVRNHQLMSLIQIMGYWICITPFLQNISWKNEASICCHIAHSQYNESSFYYGILYFDLDLLSEDGNAESEILDEDEVLGGVEESVSFNSLLQ